LDLVLLTPDVKHERMFEVIADRERIRGPRNSSSSSM
jgi:hypothetical protein